MENIRNLKKEIEDLDVFSIEGTGLLTKKAIFAALDAIQASNSRRDEEAEWQHIKALQEKKAKRMEGNIE